MLDEFKEYKQYSFDTETNTSIENHRLYYASLCKNAEFAGIERAMTIVARKYMFTDDGEKNIDSARIALEAWCGASNTPDDIKKEKIYNWLYKYIRNCLLKEKINELVKANEKYSCFSAETMELVSEVDQASNEKELHSISEKLQGQSKKEKDCNKYNTYVLPVINCVKTILKLPDKRKQFGHSLFVISESKYSQKGKKNQNDYKTIVYDKILAAASDLGPLQKNHLLLDSVEIFKELRLKSEEQKDKFLKTIAAYLLLRRYPEQEFVPINITDLINWHVSKKDEKFKQMIDQLVYEEEPVFIGINASKNQKKLKINEKILSHFKIVSETDMEKEWKAFREDNKDAVFYDDQGANVNMKECNEYQ